MTFSDHNIFMKFEKARFLLEKSRKCIISLHCCCQLKRFDFSDGMTSNHAEQHTLLFDWHIAVLYLWHLMVVPFLI